MNQVDTAAAILYNAFHSEGYGRDWNSAPAKQHWRDAAFALIEALKQGAL